MRDTQEIAREMFSARQDLEDKLDRLVHHVRERLHVRARTTHALREALRKHVRVLIAVGALAGAAITVLVGTAIRRRRRISLGAQLARRGRAYLRLDHFRSR